MQRGKAARAGQMQRSYPNSEISPNENYLRRTVSMLMVRVHLISPSLAGYYVARMNQSELAERLEIYVRMGVCHA
jgi:hypothetical protein